MEIGASAPLSGDVGPEPVVELIPTPTSNSVALSKPIPTDVNSAAFGSGLSRDFILWLVIPISPRRYQPPKSAGGGGAYIGAGATARSRGKAIVDNREAPPAARRHCRHN